MSETENLKLLPLQPLHEEAGAKFGPFAGWRMPLSYPLGVMKEHLHVRENAGLFDISHMQMVRVEGRQSGDMLARACPVEPETMADGQSKYSFLLNDKAGIVDDLIITRLDANRYVVVCNASRWTVDLDYLNDAAEGLDCTVNPVDCVMLALQGPEAANVMLALEADACEISFMSGYEPRPSWFMARSGYTGEDGFEIALPADDAKAFAQKLLSDERVEWIGLAARDSLRLEAGLCLYGQDLDEDTDPISAGLIWAIPKAIRSGGKFRGAKALEKIISDGPARKRVGLVPEGRQPVRAGAPLLDDTGQQIGTITSGGFAPSAEKPVSMGYLPPDLAKAGTVVSAEVRGKTVPMTVTKLPFTPKKSK